MFRRQHCVEILCAPVPPPSGKQRVEERGSLGGHGGPIRIG